MGENMERFLYYGSLPVEDETQHDLKTGLMQEKRKLFYNRSDGAGISAYENSGSGVALVAGLLYDIVTWITARNGEVTDGTKGTKDRRAVTSQSVIEVTQGDSGEVDVDVGYIMLGNGKYSTVGT
jgi:3-deoxy-D-manno-octulosonate 8-phosphate phosphatase KdsC-like HAD superfamily phosphatase